MRRGGDFFESLMSACLTASAVAFAAMGADIISEFAASAEAAPAEVRDDLTAAERARALAATAPPADFSRPEMSENLSGGAATSRMTPNANAFSHPSANLNFEGERDFRVGNGLFRKIWVASPSSTRASDGLGPRFNARACQACHIKDGRGSPESAGSLLLKISVPHPRSGRQVPDPFYGGQLQEFAVPGLRAEGRISIVYEEREIRLGGGETATLRAPSYSIANPLAPLHSHMALSPRVAPPMIGLGLLEAVHPADILAGADPEDENGDGISGRAREVRSGETGEVSVGRFGWKAAAPSIRTQTARAFSTDIGISTPEFPDPFGECAPAQEECRKMPHGAQEDLGGFEAPESALSLVVHYSAHLAVPARRDSADANVLNGKRIFHAAGCAQCHRPKFVTRRDAARPEHRFQLIWPHTDLLLHDMGPGLADHRPEEGASGREWRTPPLWGIGLTRTVGGHSLFLHDGRARNLLEAILWHGGEGEAAKNQTVQMTPAERADLIRFLESL